MNHVDNTRSTTYIKHAAVKVVRPTVVALALNVEMSRRSGGDRDTCAQTRLSGTSEGQLFFPRRRREIFLPPLNEFFFPERRNHYLVQIYIQSHSTECMMTAPLRNARSMGAFRLPDGVCRSLMLRIAPRKSVSVALLVVCIYILWHTTTRY